MRDAYIKDMIVEFLDDLKIVSRRSDLTIRQYEICLCEFDKYMFANEGKISDMNELRARHILKKWINVVKDEGKSVSSLNQRITALSMFYKFLISDLYNLVEVTRGIPRFMEEENDDKKFLTMDEAKNVISEVEKINKKLTPYENKRNEMMVKLFLGCGLRIMELSKLEYRHINVNEEKIYITGDISKFGKSRTVDMPSAVVSLYKEYLDMRKSHKNDSNYLFISRRNNPLSVNAVRDVVSKVSVSANGEKIHPHGLRHTYGTQQIEAGQDIIYVSQQMGHANVGITSGIYIHQQKNNTVNKANNNPMFA